MSTLKDFAKAVCQRWTNLVAGQYTPPPCPTSKALYSLLEHVNYAAGHPEEGRYPKFNVTGTSAKQHIAGVWRFAEPRPLNVAELRRLIPATDSLKSAVHVEWDSANLLHIVGVHDIGTSWLRARQGLDYHYTAPATLLIEVERPNRLSVYQGQFQVGTFSDGEAETTRGLAMPLFLHNVVRGGLADLDDRIVQPKDEPPRIYSEFEFMAFWNCYAALANLIAAAGHGGALIVLPSAAEAKHSLLRRKYPMHDRSLSDAFVSFINARHEVGNEYYLRESEVQQDDSRLAQMDWKTKRAFDHLIECTQSVARFAQCDGAVVVSRSLEVLGFGCEIAAELRPDAKVFEVMHELRHERRQLDVEQFGMRHRSAVKFASQCSEAVILVISQDGPISAIWPEADGVHVRKGVHLVNANLPWA